MSHPVPFTPRVSSTVSNRASSRRWPPRLLLSLLAAAAFSSQASAQVVAYKYFGPNSNNNGQVAGGYFLLDHSKLPSFTKEAFTDTSVYTMGNLGYAIDDALGVGPDPTFPTVNEVSVHIIQDGRGYVRLGPIPGVHEVLGYFFRGGTYGAVPLGSAIGGLAPNTDPGVAMTGWAGNIGVRTIAVPVPTIKTFTAEEVFTNPRSIGFGPNSRKPVVAGAAIYAEFTPHIKVDDVDVPMRLKDVALLYGVDHFAWLQTIKDPSLPLGYKVEIEAGNPQDGYSVLGPAPQPRFDPYPSSVLHYKMTNASNEPIRPTYKNPDGSIFIPDNYPFYYNEGTTSVNSTPTSLAFTDAPELPMGFLQTGLAREFHTELVGVKSDKSYVYTSLGFTWKSDAVHDGSGGTEFLAYDSVFDPSIVPPIVSGGVFDVEVFRPLPEAGSLTLLAIGLAIPIVCVWRHRAARRLWLKVEQPYR